MARIPRRFLISDQGTFHITWQCHNKSWLLRYAWAKDLLYSLLLRYRDRYRIKIYSYCFMSSHPHLTGFCESQEGLSDYFRLVNSLFAKTVNQRLNRLGQVVRDRFLSKQIQDDRHLLIELIYIDLNPVRAEIVDHPRAYRYCSYRYYAYGEPDPLIEPAPSYLSLGGTLEARQQAYREMVTEILKASSSRPVADRYFIGDPIWVSNRHRELKKSLLAYQRRLGRRRDDQPRVKV